MLFQLRVMVKKRVLFMNARKPFPVEVHSGSNYFWCSCGKSNEQPFCDGSHKGTDYTPVKFTAEKSEVVNFCGCRETENSPFCDGSHQKRPLMVETDKTYSVLVQPDNLAINVAVFQENLLFNSRFILLTLFFNY